MVTSWAWLLLLWTAIGYVLWGWGALFVGANPWDLMGLGEIAYVIHPGMISVPTIIILLLPPIKTRMYNACRPSAVAQLSVLASLLLLLGGWRWMDNVQSRAAAVDMVTRVMEGYRARDVAGLDGILGIKDGVHTGHVRVVFFELEDYHTQLQRLSLRDIGPLRDPWFVALVYGYERATVAVRMAFRHPELVPFYSNGQVMKLQRKSGRWTFSSQPFFPDNLPRDTIRHLSMEEVTHLQHAYAGITDEELRRRIMAGPEQMYPFLWTKAFERQLSITADDR